MTDTAGLKHDDEAGGKEKARKKGSEKEKEKDVWTEGEESSNCWSMVGMK